MENKHLPCDRLSINNFFDAIFCVNLDRRPERLENVCKEFDKHHIENIMRYSAIDGTTLDYKGPLNAGQIGCTLSHLMLLEHARDKGLKSILIFEDDLILSDNFHEIFKKSAGELPEDWCMFYLGGNHFHGIKLYSKHLVKLNGTLTTHAVGIHSRFYDIAIKTIKETLNQVIDVYYMILHSQYPCFCTNPKIAFQVAGFSDLEGREVDYSVLKN